MSPLSLTRVVRLPNVDEHDNPDDVNLGLHNGGGGGGGMGRHPRWHNHVQSYIEQQQQSLALAMLCAFKCEPMRLKQVLKYAQRNIHSATQLFKLAQDTNRIAIPAPGMEGGATLRNCHANWQLLESSFELGLRVMTMTLSSLSWKRREMVRWLVQCATEMGFEALIKIMTQWRQLFTPTEATGKQTKIHSHSN